MSANPRRARRVALVAVVAIVLLVLAVLASMFLGARPIPPDEVIRALLSPDLANPDHVVVVDQRVPRTVIGIIAGAALAMAGALMQGLTRNPLADPGLLGINAGASVAVLGAVTLLGITSPSGFVWFAFAGAAVAAVIVGVIGTRGPDGDNPAKLALTGAAVTAGLLAVTSLILTSSFTALDVYRFWAVGSLTGRGLDTVAVAIVPILLGGVIAVACARGLDLIALGRETAAGLGQNVARTRALGIVAAILLCGGATSIAGPIVFVGLVIPHMLRAIVGENYARLLLIGAPVGATFLLTADVVGRLIAPPGEVQAGVVVAFVGAPVLIALVLRRKQVAL